MSGGGRFDFDDGGTYCGGWEDGKAHGFGVCTGPKGQGEYSGAWQFGFEISGIYTWPSGNSYEGQWMQGKRHGLGVETKGRWVYRGEWTQGFKGRYGVRISTSSGAKYEGTWTTGLQDGYGVESYADGGSYEGQWLRGMRHGYGVRTSVPYGLAAHYRPKTLRDSLTSLRSENEDENVVKDRDRKINESRGGFVLRAKSEDDPTVRRRSIFDKQGRTSLKNTLAKGLRLRKQKSTGDIQESPRRATGGSVRSTISNISHASADSTHSAHTVTSQYTDSNASFVSQDDITDATVTESYQGEWKNDKRSGFGISERSDGLKYEGEWYNNKKYGYGVTLFKDGTKEEGKYKNNVLISSGKKSKLFLLRSSKIRERVDNATSASQTASQIALQKKDIAISRMSNARAKAEQADQSMRKATEDSDQARLKAKEYAPEFHQPGTDILKKRLAEQGNPPMEDYNTLPMKLSPPGSLMSNHAPQPRANSVMMRRTGSSGLPPEDEYQRDKNALPLHDTMDYANPAAHPPLQPNAVPPGGHPRGGPPNGQSNNHPHPAAAAAAQQWNKPQPMANHRDKLPNDTRYTDNRQLPTAPNPAAPAHAQTRYNDRNERFSEMLNSTVVNDHFDQYSRTNRDDSGLGRELGAPEDRSYSTQNNHHPKHQLNNGPTRSGAATPSDRSPDSGVSDADDLYSSTQARPLQRRKTLPSIVKRDSPKKTTSTKNQAGETIQSQQNLTEAQSDTYIIENGIRKRVKAEVYSRQPSASNTSAAITVGASATTDTPKDLPKRYKLETPSKLRRSRGGNMGSLPDVSACKELEMKLMPREEVHELSQQRREVLRRLREEDERKRNQEIVLRFGDLKDWCQQRQLLVLVIAVNVSLATMFFNLLSH